MMGVLKEKIGHNCGLVVAHTLHDAYSFIESLQHRGREAAGIAFIGQKQIDVIKWKGPVNRFDLKDLYKIFPSHNYHTYMAHVRYATRGRKDKILEDAHPHVIGGIIHDVGNHVIITDCEIVGVHNGQVNPEYLGELDKTQLRTDCDTEALLHFYEKYGERELLKRIPGSYTLAIADKNKRDIIVLRDRTGIKPGILGKKDGRYGVASEDKAFRDNGGEFIEDLMPGFVYYISPEGNYIKEKIVEAALRHCFFEYNYIADVDSIMNDTIVRGIREMLGETLAQEFHPDADLVTFLPRCPEVAAKRYSEKVRIPFEYVFYKSRGERSFLGSTLDDRQKSIEENLYLIPEIQGIENRDFLRDKTIIVIDDSTIRGNNSKRAVKLLRDAGVKKIYLLNYTPKIGIVGEDGVPRGCLYGVDMPPNDNFIVRGRTNEQINKEIGAEVYFLSVEGMLKTFEKVGMPRRNLCYFCIGGNKPF